MDVIRMANHPLDMRQIPQFVTFLRHVTHAVVTCTAYCTSYVWSTRDRDNMGASLRDVLSKEALQEHMQQYGGVGRGFRGKIGT